MSNGDLSGEFLIMLSEVFWRYIRFTFLVKNRLYI